MEKYEKYSRYYNENSFWVKIKKLAGKASSSLLYYALVLYYCLISNEVSIKNKSLIIAALGYLIIPIDALPDFIPALGLTDDLTAIMLVYNKIKGSLTPDIERKAKSKVNDLTASLSGSQRS